MVDVEYIRKLNLVQHWSIRQIARRLNLSRNTVTKYLSAPDPTPRYRLAVSRPRPVLGAFEGVIRLWLDEDKQRPRKQRHTAHRIYERLRDEYFFPGGESTIRKYVRSVKAPVPEAFLPWSTSWARRPSATLARPMSSSPAFRSPSTCSACD